MKLLKYIDKFLNSSFHETRGLFQPNLAQKIYPWVKGIQVGSNEGFRPFPRGDNYESANLKNHLLQNHWANFNQNLQKSSLAEQNSNLF